MMAAYRPGDAVGRYQILQILGRGSFGVVLLAEDPLKAQKFAMKIVPCDHLDASTAARAREAALAEAELLQRLRHPHVVSCHDVCWDAERRVVWIALDHMNGGDLQSVIDSRRNSHQQPPGVSFVRRVLSAVGSALRFVHSQGVLHRDVKPSNVLLTGEGMDASSQHLPLDKAEIKLADFGISKILEATSNANTVVGTPPYMSPEIVCGKPYGPASDAWALGACLYELVSLRRPFEAGNQLALVRQIVDHEPAALPAGTALDVAEAVGGLLRKDPDERLSLGDLVRISPEGQVAVPSPGFAPPAAPARARHLRDSLLTPRETPREVVAGTGRPSQRRGGGRTPRQAVLRVCGAAVLRVSGPSVPADPDPHEAVKNTQTWSDVSEETLADWVPPSPRLSVDKKSLALAFEHIQEEKIKEKRTPGGRRWFKFGNLASPRSQALVQAHGEGQDELTYVTAFSVERGDGGDSPLPSSGPHKRVVRT